MANARCHQGKIFDGILVDLGVIFGRKIEKKHRHTDRQRERGKERETKRSSNKKAKGKKLNISIENCACGGPFRLAKIDTLAVIKTG